MISRKTIDDVFEAARVEEVIGDFIQLKKSGSNYKGKSPFSNERTPSFMVSPAKNIWKDFSSGKGGTAVSFLMEHEQFTYPEAIRYLANKYNIEIEETEQTPEQKEEASLKESLYLINEYATKYFNNSLLNLEEGKAIGLSYFKERGFTDETIKKFLLGYSPVEGDKWDVFTNEAIKKGYKVELLKALGLTKTSNERQYDGFRGRVIFPIFSMSGRTLGYGGRILGDNKKTAKYLNSPESEVYHKSKVLYGLFQAKGVIIKKDNCFLVEGYTDVLQFFQSGIENVVSSSGTALTSDQIRLISRLTKNITILFDGDDAGLRASLRGIDLILEQGMNVKICTFPEGEDPDSFAKKNNLEELNHYLEDNAQDFIHFKASLLATESKNDPIKRAEVIREILMSISLIPDNIKKELYIQECSRIMNIDEANLFNTLAQILKKQKKDDYKVDQNKPKPFEVVASENIPVDRVDELFELERKIIHILLIYGKEEVDFEDVMVTQDEEGGLVFENEINRSKVYNKVFLDLQSDEVEFTNKNFQLLFNVIINKFNIEEDLKIDVLVSEVEPEGAQLITNILMNEEKYTLHRWDEKEIYVKDKNIGISQFVTETILNLRRFLIDSKIKDLSKSAMVNGSFEDDTVLSTTLDFQSLRKLITDKLNRVV
ncbi:MAG: DNA primase [Flavobacteriaceae bacterium]